jgi:hypothetical protein
MSEIDLKKEIGRGREKDKETVKSKKKGRGKDKGRNNNKERGKKIEKDRDKNGMIGRATMTEISTSLGINTTTVENR